MKSYPNFSVLMSLYYKEKPENLCECINSILEQTVKPNEIVIVYDGALTDELYSIMNEYIDKNNGIFVIKENQNNQGLGLALASGVPLCNNEIIARMDTDDICRNDRFEKQLDFMLAHPELDICGSYIQEFDTEVNNIISIRKVPLEHEKIAEYQKTRTAVNHVTAMFKKSSILKAGNYENCLLMEDDMMWTRLLLSGSRFGNIPDCLVYVRTGRTMIERRGGWNYFKKYKSGRKKILDTGYIGYGDYLKTIFVQFIVALVPVRVRLFIFTKLLR